MFFSLEQIQDYEFGGGFGSHRLASGLKLLIDKKFVERRNNPNKGWDRTYQYRFMLDAVQQSVNNLSPFLNIQEWKIESSTMHSWTSKDALLEVQEAIQHDPEHDPNRKDGSRFP